MLLNRFRRASGLGIVFLFSLLLSTSCLVRTRKVVPRGQPANKPPLTATREDLLDRLHRLTDGLHSFNLKVDMSPSVGGVFGGTVTDYPTIQGFLIFRQPDQIRVLGLDPVVHSTVFDMVSLGNDFHVYIPPKSLFIEGNNDAPASSKNKLENLRPVAFMNALLIRPPASGEIALLEDVSDETISVYKLLLIERVGDDLHLLRTVSFDRYTLDVIRQRTFDIAGHVTSETKYSNWETHGKIRFPHVIDMARPQDGYALLMTVNEFTPNPADITDEKFILTPPPSVQIRKLGAPAEPRP